VTLGRQALEDLRDRGVSDPETYVALDAAVVSDVTRKWDSDSAAGVGALVSRLKAAQRGERVNRSVSLAEREAEYGRSIVDWLMAHMPDVCAVNPKVVEATRRAYGDIEANAMAHSTGPHPAAVAAVIRCHHAAGRQTVKASAVRAAVRAFDDRAIEDLKVIASERSGSIEIKGVAA
jgi:hypothetical protein